MGKRIHPFGEQLLSLHQRADAFFVCRRLPANEKGFNSVFSASLWSIRMPLRSTAFFVPDSFAQYVSLAERLWRPVSRARLQNQMDRAPKIDPETRRDIDRFCATTRSQNSPNDLFIKDQSLRITLLRPDFAMKSHKPFFAHPTEGLSKRSPM